MSEPKFYPFRTKVIMTIDGKRRQKTVDTFLIDKDGKIMGSTVPPKEQKGMTIRTNSRDIVQAIENMHKPEPEPGSYKIKFEMNPAWAEIAALNSFG